MDAFVNVSPSFVYDDGDDDIWITDIFNEDDQTIANNTATANSTATAAADHVSTDVDVDNVSLPPLVQEEEEEEEQQQDTTTNIAATNDVYGEDGLLELWGQVYPSLFPTVGSKDINPKRLKIGQEVLVLASTKDIYLFGKPNSNMNNVLTIFTNRTFNTTNENQLHACCLTCLKKGYILSDSTATVSPRKLKNVYDSIEEFFKKHIVGTTDKEGNRIGCPHITPDTQLYKDIMAIKKERGGYKLNIVKELRERNIIERDNALCYNCDM